MDKVDAEWMSFANQTKTKDSFKMGTVPQKIFAHKYF